ncbi:hypothetical protein V3W47_18935 [Deinococcus sp. YIM 134068]|uniref:hypothetical protein n=1 Tax=Deinococcus lichenicola TaxID=3118910 RepID=UPI002F9444E1
MTVGVQATTAELVEIRTLLIAVSRLAEVNAAFQRQEEVPGYVVKGAENDMARLLDADPVRLRILALQLGPVSG